MEQPRAVLTTDFRRPIRRPCVDDYQLVDRVFRVFPPRLLGVRDLDYVILLDNQATRAVSASWNGKTDLIKGHMLDYDSFMELKSVVIPYRK